MSKHNSPDPVVLVSGASSGIGAAVCRLLVEQQFRVVAAARNRDRLEQLAAQLGDALYPVSYTHLRAHETYITISYCGIWV